MQQVNEQCLKPTDGYIDYSVYQTKWHSDNKEEHK